MNETDNAVKIAVVQEQIHGLREQARQHAATTKEQFDKLDSKVDELLAVMNRGRGAYAASLAIAGTIGAAALSAINYVLNKIGG